jgi:hypothetical protein
VIERHDPGDVGPQPSVTDPLDDLSQLGAIGLDDKVNREAVGRPCLDGPGDGDERAAGPNRADGSFLDVAADDVEHQIDAADCFQIVVLEIHELVCAEVERLLAVGGASGPDDPGAGLSRELRHDRPDRARSAVRDHGLPRLQAAVLEESLPRGEPGDRQARGRREADVTRQRRQVA